MSSSSIKYDPFTVTILFTNGQSRTFRYGGAKTPAPVVQGCLVFRNSRCEDLLIPLAAVQTVDISGVRESDDDA